MKKLFQMFFVLFGIALVLAFTGTVYAASTLTLNVFRPVPYFCDTYMVAWGTVNYDKSWNTWTKYVQMDVDGQQVHKQTPSSTWWDYNYYKLTAGKHTYHVQAKVQKGSVIKTVASLEKLFTTTSCIPK